MMVFPFTKKKFLSLSDRGRHVWLIKWLSQIYEKLVANRLGEQSCFLFLENYLKVLEWIGGKPHSFPDNFVSDNKDIRMWIEFVSDSIHYHRIKSGIFPKDYDLLPRAVPATLTKDKKTLSEIKHSYFDYHIALDGLRSLFNIGSIFRTCDASGFASVILGSTCGPEHPAVQKTSMGAHKWVSCTKTCDLALKLEKMKQQGFQITGIETVCGSESYIHYNWNEKGVVVFGNEEYGISSHVMKICDDFVHIPMFGVKNSLNVANSVSIIVFHIAGCCKTAQIVRA